jgi:hypothetical protein
MNRCMEAVSAKFKGGTWWRLKLRAIKIKISIFSRLELLCVSLASCSCQ